MTASVEQHIRKHFDQLSRTLRLTARWVLEHPVQVATRSLETLSAMSGQSSASFIRLAQQLGYTGWTELRTGFADTLRKDQESDTFATRLSSYSQAALPESMLRKEMHNIQGCYTPTNAAVIAQAVQRMAEARTIALISRRSCSALMIWLHYLLHITTPNVILADDRGGAYGLDLLDIGKEDVVISASFAPCSRDTVTATRHAREAGAWTLGIVDGPLSSLARITHQHLLVNKNSDVFFDSMVGAIFTIQWLASEWVAHIGPHALERAKSIQNMMITTGAFDPDDLPALKS